MQSLAQAQFPFDRQQDERLKVGNFHIEAILASTAAGGGEALRASRWDKIPRDTRIAAASLSGLASSAGAGALADLSPADRAQLHVQTQALIEQLQQLVRATKPLIEQQRHH